MQELGQPAVLGEEASPRSAYRRDEGGVSTYMVYMHVSSRDLRL